MPVSRSESDNTVKASTSIEGVADRADGGTDDSGDWGSSESENTA